MLRTSLLDVSASEVTADFTPDDFTQLYRIIASDSYNKSYPLASALVVIRKKLFNYVDSVFSDNKKFIAADLRNLAGQLDMLLKRNFFEDKLTIATLQIIKQDILNYGKNLAAKIPEAERKEFILSLTLIDDEYEARVPFINVVPDVLKTGLTKTEQHSITVKNISAYHSKPGADLCDRGLQHFNKHEWEAAIALFYQAISAECEMAAESKSPVNEENIRSYQRNIAYSFNNAGIDFFDTDCYSESIESFKKAICAIQSIKADYAQEKDRDVIDTYNRSLARAYNQLAVESFYMGKLDQAILNHGETILTLKRIRGGIFTDEDNELYLYYQRNLAYVLSEQGHAFYYQNEFDKAIKCYEAVSAVAKEMKSELLDRTDLSFQSKNEYHLRLTKATKDRMLVGNNPNTLFNKRRKGNEETDEDLNNSRKRKREETGFTPK